MSVVSGVAVYFIIWWLVLFTVLPWGSHSAHELGEDVPEGHAPSAPVHPAIAKKFVVTTIISAICFAVFYFVVTNDLIGLDDIPFFTQI